MGKPLDSPASFRPISLTSCVSKLLKGVLHLLSLQAGFHPGRSNVDQIFFFLSPFCTCFSNPSRALGQVLLLSTSLKCSTVSEILLFSMNLFQLASFLALLVGLNFSLPTEALEWFFKMIKAAHFESIEVFSKNLFLALYFSLFSLMIFLRLYLLPLVALFMLKIWPSGPPPP